MTYIAIALGSAMFGATIGFMICAALTIAKEADRS